MDIKYTYRKTPAMEKSLADLSVLKRLIDLLPQIPQIEENIRRKSLLKSALFSARIEGNSLKLRDLNLSLRFLSASDKQKMEVFNILSALRWIYSSAPGLLTDDTLLALHRMVLKGLSPDAGFRREPSAIFNRAGVAVYMTPPPGEIAGLLKELLDKANSERHEGPVNAALCHFAFEKIHPFLDGNGRVGRLLSIFVLHKTADDLRGLIALEEFFDNNREAYYDLLSQNGRDITSFIEFFLSGMVSQGEDLLENIKRHDGGLAEEGLLPRRREILEIVRDHGQVSFDFLKRRFVNVAESTLHYDLGCLLKSGFIKKLGNTRGAIYAPSDKS